jgi:isoaspartyl peptidase/L-asparaginase-like protein (Ntn-hydrolase superfamily)
MQPIALGIHGGCGVMARGDLDEAGWSDARTELARALRAGWRVLQAHGRAVAAVEAATPVMAPRSMPRAKPCSMPPSWMAQPSRPAP